MAFAYVRIDNFWLHKIVPITDAVLCFKPLVVCAFAAFYAHAVNGVFFATLFKTFLSEREKIFLYRRIVFDIEMQGRERGNNVQMRPFV